MGRKSQSTHPMALKRLALGLSAPEMAKLLNCAVSTIKSIESNNGRLKMSASMAARLESITDGDVKSAIDRMVEEYRAKLYRQAGLITAPIAGTEPHLTLTQAKAI